MSSWPRRRKHVRRQVKATTEQAKVEKLFPASPGMFVVTATLRSETRRASALW